VKLARVMRVEIGGPGDFAKVGSKQAVIDLCSMQDELIASEKSEYRHGTHIRHQ
jgi:hypothetical protein